MNKNTGEVLWSDSSPVRIFFMANGLVHPLVFLMVYPKHYSQVVMGSSTVSEPILEKMENLNSFGSLTVTLRRASGFLAVRELEIT